MEICSALSGKFIIEKVEAIMMYSRSLSFLLSAYSLIVHPSKDCTASFTEHFTSLHRFLNSTSGISFENLVTLFEMAAGGLLIQFCSLGVNSSSTACLTVAYGVRMVAITFYQKDGGVTLGSCEKSPSISYDCSMEKNLTPSMHA